MNKSKANISAVCQKPPQGADILTRALMEGAALTPEELQSCQHAAWWRGLTLAAWVRVVMLDAARSAFQDSLKSITSDVTRERKAARRNVIEEGGSTAPEIMAKLTAWAYFSMAGDAVRFQAFPHADTSAKAKQYRISARDCGLRSWSLDRMEEVLLTGYRVAEMLYNLALKGAKFSGEPGTIIHGKDAEKHGYPPPSTGAMEFTPSRAWASIAEDTGMAENELLEYFADAITDEDWPPLTYPSWAGELLPPRATPK